MEIFLYQLNNAIYRSLYWVMPGNLLFIRKLSTPLVVQLCSVPLDFIGLSLIGHFKLKIIIPKASNFECK